MTFLELGFEVMKQRKKDGVRGLDREWSRWRLHVSTADFANKDIAEITSPDIRRWLRVMADKRAIGPGEERNLSRQTINRCQSLVSAIFSEAVERELIDTNPCLGVKTKRVADGAATRRKWAYFTLEEEQAIASCEAIPQPDRLVILFALYTGLRQGELHNLELADLHVDGDRPRLVVRFGSKGLPPKNGKIDEVPLIPQAVDIARRWLEILPTFAPSNPSRIVFPTARGTRRQQSKTLGRSNTFRDYLKLAGIEKHARWHDLRHGCASALIGGWWGRRWPITEVREMLRHSSVTITERYAHLADTVLHDAARATTTVHLEPVATVALPTISIPVAPAPTVDVSRFKNVARALARTTRKAVWSVVEQVGKAVRHVA